ncbi:hypothetical protein [Pseudomonas sp. GL-RE-26]|uniref:hypothetical protein n=1 Tax=Pseudomonas sp. GL-RE-26 TaxID=2832390 RepID=UPI001CBD79D6|nr:hypothetical protein [Pseudomonas sp. GL-RE-26]
MRIKLSPNDFSDDRALELIKFGDTLTVNGEAFDFSPIGDGDMLPSAAINSPWFLGEVERVDGELTVTVWLPNPWNASPEQRFPKDLVNVPDGVVLLPLPLPITDEQQAEREALIQQLMIQQGVVQ